jgi:malonyl-CoA/methylmalonyl-CoA synthetase
MQGSEFVVRAAGHAERVAIVDQHGTWTYGDLLDRSASLAASLLDGRRDLHGARVLLLACPGLEYAAALWGIWRAGGIAVPVSPQQPPAEWAYVAADSLAACAMAGQAYAAQLAPVAVAAHARLVPCDPRARSARLPALDPSRAALMLYTSGTTSTPKGVVLTHANIQAQVECLVRAWEWEEGDRILHVLPLHHTHGVINALACALWSGAVCEMLPGFDARRTWAELASGRISVFMAVPSIYQRLLAAHQAASPDEQRRWADGARALRVAVSGSAPLPSTVFDQWQDLVGQPLLERYGTTETGMVLSNPLRGERHRGSVGVPLPGIDVRLVNPAGEDVADGEAGEVFVRGPGVFGSYWERTSATASAFAEGGWYRTGDVATRGATGFRILGRLSVDIIKTGGEKVSALEVEEMLRTHPDVLDCAVVGVPDPEWGERVAAVLVMKPDRSLTLDELRTWARSRAAAWKIPTRITAVADLPRNTMGKVTKVRLAELFAGVPASD